MKKILLITLACMMTMLASAQIKRTIYGITLGADAENARQALLERKTKYVAIDEGDIPAGHVIGIENPIFSGERWDVVGALLNKSGKIYMIMFTMEASNYDFSFNYTPKLLGKYNKLTEMLDAKYSEYADTTAVNDKESGYDKAYGDKETEIAISYTNKNHEESITLMYIDVAEYRKYQDDISDEL